MLADYGRTLYPILLAEPDPFKPEPNVVLGAFAESLKRELDTGLLKPLARFSVRAVACELRPHPVTGRAPVPLAVKPQLCELDLVGRCAGWQVSHLAHSPRR